jgi:drug/metabolite transporter (DMT)-like permease
MDTMLIKYRGLRRALGAMLVGVGAVLMWLAPEVWSGVVLLVAGIALEAAGIALEHRNRRSREDSHAVEQ